MVLSVFVVVTVAFACVGLTCVNDISPKVCGGLKRCVLVRSGLDWSGLRLKLANVARY